MKHKTLKLPASPIEIEEIFTQIYKQHFWGKKEGQLFFSGAGSHDPAVYVPYVTCLTDLFSKQAVKLNVVDIGCGDFFIGQKIRHLFNNYIAMDVVAELIEDNRNRYQHLNVDFRTLNAITETLPAGNLVILRQVLQHLDNESIQKILQKITTTYQYALVTEHLPNVPNFVANIDKTPGAGIRLKNASGLELTKPPFNLSFKSQRNLLEVSAYAGVIKTTLYQFY